MRLTEQDIAERYAERYRLPEAEVTRQIEMAVIGGDWGANGYTTMAEAEELRAALRLQPGMRLLDLGSGRGWPGLYLSAASGCEVVLVDVPTEGLRKGLGRAVKEGIAQSVCAVTASARRLPFRASSFDAIVHADVLC